MNVVERAKAPTPKFFRVLRTVGLALLAVSGSIVAAPVALPAIVVTVASYAAVAGTILSAVSQVTVDDDAKNDCKKKTKTCLVMESNNTIHAGTAAGTVLSIVPNISSEDVLKTIVLAIVGAIVSFTVSLLLKRLTKFKNK